MTDSNMFEPIPEIKELVAFAAGPVGDTPAGPAPALPAPPPKIRKKPISRYDFGDGEGRVPAHKHANGGGWVADTAKVSEECLIGYPATVYHNATVLNGTHMSGNARVCGSAKVRACVMRDRSCVGGNTIIKNSVVANHARVFGGDIVDADIEGNCVIRDNPIIRRAHDPSPHTRIMARFSGHCIIFGTPVIFGGTVRGAAMVFDKARLDRADIIGHVLVGGNAVINESTVKNQLPYPSTGPNYPEDNATRILSDTRIYLSSLTGRYDMASGNIMRSEIDLSTYFTEQRTDNPYLRLDVHARIMLIDERITDYNVFLTYNRSKEDIRATLVRAQRNTGQAFDINNLTRPRRISALTP